MDATPKCSVIPLLLIGGQSTRMGKRKELLQFPDGRLAIEHALERLRSAIPLAPVLYISAHDDSQVEGIQDVLKKLDGAPLDMGGTSTNERASFEIKLIFDEHMDIGPAAGLLAAHKSSPEATWMALGCDYPFLSPAALQHLILEYEPPVTSFVNEDGFVEPLIAIWGPAALNVLAKNVEDGKSGLTYTIKQLRGKAVTPLRQQWIKGTNTIQEWGEAMSTIGWDMAH